MMWVVVVMVLVLVLVVLVLVVTVVQVLDLTAGVEMLVGPGDKVEQGQVSHPSSQADSNKILLGVTSSSRSAKFGCI